MYSPGVLLAGSLEELSRSVFEQLQLIAQSMRGFDEMKLRVLHVEPTRPREGMVVYADGTDWNPGSGEGVYVYASGGWSKL